jgi:hypothetical protein
MKWFKHDGNALSDARIEKIIMKYGIEGYGLYFACIEIVAGALTTDNITFELEHDAEILAYKFKIDTLRVEEMMKYFVHLGLFEYNYVTNKVICGKLAKRLDNTMSQNVEIKKMIGSDEFKETLSNFKELEGTKSTIQDNTIQDTTYIDLLEYWNSKNIIVHDLDKFNFNVKKKHKDIIYLYGIEDIKKAIDNYDIVIKDDKYYFSHKWTLLEFIVRGLEKFVDNSKPLENYLSDKNTKEVTPNQSHDTQYYATAEELDKIYPDRSKTYDTSMLNGLLEKFKEEGENAE